MKVPVGDASVDTGPEVAAGSGGSHASGSRIEAVGSSYPRQRLTTAELLGSRRHRFPLDLEKHTGIRERRVCGEGEDSFTLAIDAARDALRHSRHDAAELGMVIACGITRYGSGLGWHIEPAMSLVVKDKIGARQAFNFDLSNACAGMLTGVHVLDNFIARGVVRSGMVVSGEYITSLSHNAARTVRTAASRQIASLTLGDAGAAVILEQVADRSAGIASSELATVAEYSDLCIGRPADDAPGAQMSTQSNKLHRAAILHSTSTILEALSSSGFEPETIDYIIPHQTAVPAINAGIKHVKRKIGQGYPAKVIFNLEEFGNTASTTHFATLRHCLEQRRLQPGDRVLMICSASGLTTGATVFTVDRDLWERYGSSH